MPSISDPGQELVAACIQEGISVISLPGSTAGLTALIASGLNAQPNYFYGFLPRRKKRPKSRIKTIGDNKGDNDFFYESPYRLKKILF